MKQSVKFILLLCVPLVCFRMPDDPRKLILKKWKLEEASIQPALRQRIKTLKKSDPEKAQKLEDNFEDAVTVTKLTTYQYYGDGTYKSRVSIMSEKATWRILDDNKTLVVKSEKIGEIRKVIVSITNVKLILKDEEAGAPEIIYLLAE